MLFVTFNVPAPLKMPAPFVDPSPLPLTVQLRTLTVPELKLETPPLRALLMVSPDSVTRDRVAVMLKMRIFRVETFAP
jgi:hypothetical protein